MRLERPPITEKHIQRSLHVFFMLAAETATLPELTHVHDAVSRSLCAIMKETVTHFWEHKRGISLA
jgi:hypothetical protein